MQKLAPLFALAVTFLVAAPHTFAQSTPRIYIMMKDGKLSEMVNGKKEAVTQDISLTNGTTIHPNGNIDDRDGNKKQLQEGEYMTMDGKIRKLKDMGAPAKSAPRQ